MQAFVVSSPSLEKHYDLTQKDNKPESKLKKRQKENKETNTQTMGEMIGSSLRHAASISIRILHFLFPLSIFAAVYKPATKYEVCRQEGLPLRGSVITQPDLLSKFSF